MDDSIHHHMSMPNFLIIGAAKSGTSALYHYLRQHPQIYMSPVKEPHFFAFEGRKPHGQGPGDTIGSAITSLEDYQALFKKTAAETAIGEASTSYLYISGAAERIQHYIPEVKLIAMLRHPAERAYSAFMHLVREGREPLADLAQALREEETRIHNNWGPLWHYTQGGYYYSQLKRYFDRFDRGQIKIYLYEDFTTKPHGVIQNIYQFLEVDETFTPDIDIRYNTSGTPKNELLHTFLIKKNPVKTILKTFFPAKLRRHIRNNLMNRNLVKLPLSPALRRQLIDVYREDILKLQELIQRDLSLWLK
jgi:hypothetical protein